MGQGRSLPRFHTDQQLPDGLSVVSDAFLGTDLCDDYDAFTESMLRALKAPDMTHMPIVYKDTIVEENEDGSSFEVKVVVDATRFSQYLHEACGEHTDRIVAHKQYTFSCEKRTLRCVAFQDHWADVPPEVAWTAYFSFGTPLSLQFYIMSNGRRHACERVAEEFRPLLVDIEFDLRKTRLPEAKLTWDPDRLCLHTGRLGSHFTDYDDLYDSLLIAVRQSLGSVVPDPSIMPAGLRIEQMSIDRTAVILTASNNSGPGKSILEVTCVHNKIEGYILRTYGSEALPNLKFQISRDPLVVKVFHKKMDNVTDLLREHTGGHNFAQQIIDQALATKQATESPSLSRYAFGVTRPFGLVGGCCASRGVLALG